MSDVRNTLGDYLAEGDPLGALWPHLVAAVFHDSPREAHPERLTPPARTIYFVGCFHGEIVNGGFSQFFSNSSGNYVAETFDALRATGASLCLELLEKAVQGPFAGRRPPADREQRCKALFAFEAQDPDYLQELDGIYYRDVDALRSRPREDLYELQLTYMRTHAAVPVLAAT